MEFLKFFHFQPVIASGIEIGLLAVGLVLSAAAGLLLTPKLSRNPLVRNNTAPVLAERGAFIPRMIGTFRLGCVFAWAGKPRNITAESGGFLGVGSTKTNITSQPGWHLICIGPAKRLIRIYQAGKIIFPIAGESVLDSATTPSGSTYALKSKQGTFRIYWGDNTSGPDPLLASAAGISCASKFPNVMYIVWNNKHLQTANQWPELNYEVEVRPQISGSYISGTPWNDGTLIPPGLAEDGSVIPAGVGFRRDNGADPIHTIAELILNTYPQGVGVPLANIDTTFFNAAQAITQSEGILSNVVCQDGNKASSMINDILSDIGGVIPQVGDKLIIFLIRKETSIPTLTTDALVAPLPEKVFLQGDQPTNRIIYLYKDREWAFRDNDITIDDDSVQLGRLQSVQTPLNSVIDLDIANVIIDRKQLENLVNVKTFTITANRQARTLSPGQVFFNSDLGQVRVTSVQRPDQSSTIALECVADVYSPISGAGGTGLKEVAFTPVLPVYPDAQLFMWIVPYDLMPQGANFGDAWVMFMPIRQNIYTLSQDIFVTFDSGSDGWGGTAWDSMVWGGGVAAIFNYVQTNKAFFIQGLLTTNVKAGVSWDYTLPYSSDTYQIEINIRSFTCVDETGLPIASSDLDFDISMFPDLTNYPERWRSGENCCAIEDQTGVFREVIYFKSITVSPNADCYYLNGVLRNRMIKTLSKDTQWSGRVVLFRKWDINPVFLPNPTTGAAWSPTNTLRAYTNATGIDGNTNTIPGNAKVTKQCYSSFQPLSPANFRSIDADSGFYAYSWAAGFNLQFKWTNRPLIQGVGQSCGTQLAGVAISPIPIPFEGTLTIKIWPDKPNADAGTGLKRTFVVAQGSKQFYTATQLTTDFGAIVSGSTLYVTYQVNVNGVTGPLSGQSFQAR